MAADTGGGQLDQAGGQLDRIEQQLALVMRVLVLLGSKWPPIARAIRTAETEAKQ